MEITDKQNKKIAEIAKKYQLKLVLLFGSRVLGKTHKESDFDVAYLAGKKLTFDEENLLNYEFTNIFGHDRVDTVDIKKAPPLFFYGIFQDCQILFQEDEMIFPTYRAYAFKKYVETKPFLEKSLKD